MKVAFIFALLTVGLSAHAEQPSKITIFGDTAKQMYTAMSDDLAVTSGGGMPGAIEFTKKQGKNVLCGLQFQAGVSASYECVLTIDEAGNIQSPQ